MESTNWSSSQSRKGGGLLGMIADKYSCIPMDKCINLNISTNFTVFVAIVQRRQHINNKLEYLHQGVRYLRVPGSENELAIVPLWA